MLRLLVPLVALVLFTGCDGASPEAQRLFEDAALLSPVSGITQTDAAGAISSRDADDWRIGPAYLNNIVFLQLPSPNPVVRGDALRFTVDAVVGVPGGIQVFVLAEDPSTGVLRIQTIRDPGATGADAVRSDICQFVISASQIGLSGPGLYRLLLLDGRDGVVSYGDVEVR